MKVNLTKQQQQKLVKEALASAKRLGYPLKKKKR